ncbi:hypothetical protein ABL78_4673 [Leptomonas seymouri]|uniref:Cyclic nucleotide-binding domain-containing protein n=1 Tax=Leptomonas seymouri TaxID=5684 RepID=A0A0N0P5Q1_LEPSE|nr:hypothetical protein ABL78_4673 [Leptomonas seymouri]|eukprot:KPI86247.1 hypothetical protein ABL78_4673 [Leptomonas seymouri]
MKPDVLRVKSLHVLKRLFAPLVALHVFRTRRKENAKKRKVSRPSPEVLKALQLFSRWPTTTLQSWIASGVVEVHEKGTTIAFAGEPRRATDIFWLLAGKLTQVPNKAELRRCAGDLVHLPTNVPKTGPLILPSHFMESNTKKSLPPLTPVQEQVVDSLSLYHAGQLVDAERLILGGERLRSLRCQSDVVLLRFSLSSCLRIVQSLPSAARSITVDAARQYVQRTMAQFSGTPSTPSIMSANPVLAALPPTVLAAICFQTKPFVFLKSEVISDNVFAAEWLYFLESGQVRIEDSNGPHSRIVSEPFTAIGMHAFVQSSVPDYFDQKSRATAAVYCEVWGLPISAVLSACDAASRLRCALAAAQLLRARGFGRLPLTSALWDCACFLDLSEAAVTAVARALRLRVYTPGETVTLAGRIPTFGFLVVAGDVRLHRSVERDTQHLKPGRAYYFCESLAKMRANETVVSHSSSIILQGSPGLLFEAMEVAGVTPDEARLLLHNAQEYVDRIYGDGSSEVSKAQYAAAERVREYKRRQMEAMHSNSTAPLSDAAAAEVLKNELLTSLEVQLHALHPDAAAAAKFEYFRAGKAAMGDDAAVHPSPSPPPRRLECFSLDEQGKLITSSAPTMPSVDAVHQQQRQQLPQQQPHQQQQQRQQQQLVATTEAAPMSTGQSALTLPPLPRSSPAIPGKANAFVKAPAAPLRSAPPAYVALRAAVRIQPPGTKASKSIPSQRVASMRAAASRLKDEADGIDRRKDNRYPFARDIRR